MGASWYQGGSNYNWYAPDGWSGKSYWDYSIIRNYDKTSAWPYGPHYPVSVVSNVDYQLNQMHQNGQRRLRIGIFHGRVQPSDQNVSVFNCQGTSEYFGSLINSYYNGVRGELSPQCWANFVNYLTAVKTKGFQEVMVSLHPLNGNDPNTWSSMNWDLYEENKALILNVRQRLQSIGLSYRIDLGNELTPHTSSTQGLKDYTRNLWSSYPYKWETVGFSINCDTVSNCRDRIGQIPVTYQGSDPPVFSLHIYQKPYPDDPYNVYVQAYYKLRDLNKHYVPWIIGEVTYNDASEAQALTNAQQGLGNTVYFLTQWPTNGFGGDANPPLSFYEYWSRGW